MTSSSRNTTCWAFDRNDDGKISFRKLLIDPKGMFTFKSGSGKSICCVAEAIESYGYIKIDGTKSAGDSSSCGWSATRPNSGESS